jgi:opacity protein-like surface antigen
MVGISLLIKERLMKHISAIVTIILGFVCFSSTGLAIPLLGSGTVARAGSGVAAISIHDVYSTNPSTIVGPRYYSVGGGYNSDGNTFHASVVDTKTSEIAGAVGYYHQTQGTRFEDPHWKTHGVQGAFSGLISPQLALGVTGKYIWYEQLPVSGNLAFPTLEEQGFDVDAGAHYRFNTSIAIGLVFRNLFRSEHLEKFPMPDVVAGVALTPMKGLAIYADSGRWFKTSPLKDQWQFAGGADYNISSSVVIRAGYRLITENISYQLLGAGLGITFDSIQLAYAGSFYLKTTPLENRHGVSLTLMF